MNQLGLLTPLVGVENRTSGAELSVGLGVLLQGFRAVKNPTCAELLGI